MDDRQSRHESETLTITLPIKSMKKITYIVYLTLGIFCGYFHTFAKNELQEKMEKQIKENSSGVEKAVD